MKKLLFLSASALMLLFAACTNLPEPYVPSSPEEAVLIVNAETYGTKSSDVYCGPRRAADVNGNMWEYLPDYPSEQEIASVMAYIATRPDGVDWPGYTSFYVQHLSGAHHVYSYTDHNGAEHTMDGTQSMELLHIQEADGEWQHVNNFNAGQCDNAATHNCALMTNGFLSAIALDEYASLTLTAWRLFYFEGCYYLGFDYYCSKDDASADPAVAPDGCFDDWVLKIIPGMDETPVDPTIEPADQPVPPRDTLLPEVEWDLHQQEHATWNEIKTTIHLRDTVNARIFLPIPQEYQAVADDFDIRLHDQTEYARPTLTICDVTYQFDLTITHLADGIEILVMGDTMQQALRAARAAFYDGITFEVHSYVYHSITPEIVWSWLKTVEPLHTHASEVPSPGDYATHTFGQISSAYYPEEHYDFDFYPSAD